MGRPSWISISELIIVALATIVAALNLSELKDQAKSQDKQLTLLSETVESLSRQATASELQLAEARAMSKIQSKFIVLSNLQPIYTYNNVTVDETEDSFTISFDFSNLSQFPLAIDDTYTYSMYDCPTGQALQSTSPPDIHSAEALLNDRNHLVVNPYSTQNVSYTFSPASEENLSKLAPSMKSPFHITINIFTWIENLDQFSEIFERTGLDLTDEHLYRGERMSLPINSRVITQDLFLVHDGKKLKVVDDRNG